jgi:hypothetical protein
LDRESLAEIALYFNKTLKEISDHIDEWNYDFLTATYYLLLFMKMQGRQPKIKSNMKKYSQFITYANCTITSTTAVGMNSTTNQSTTLASQSLPPTATPSSSAAQTNANRILVEKQLANLATGATPKIMNPSPIVKSNNSNSGNTKVVANKPPQQQHSENTNPNQPGTPHPKSVTATSTTVTASSNHNQKPKQLFFDEINTQTAENNKNTCLATKREARSKTKTTPSSGATVTATKSNTISSATGSAISNALKNANNNNIVKKKDHSTDTCSSTSSTSSASSSSESSESLSASSSSSANNGESSNFVMPSRVTRSKNK